MKKILFLGAGCRELALADRLLKEKNFIYIMSEKRPPFIDPNIFFFEKKYDEKILLTINPDIVFSFSDEYVLDEEMNCKIHKLFSTKIVAFAQTKYLKLEKDKIFFNRKIGFNNLQLVNKVELKKLDLKKTKYFIRENKNNGYVAKLTMRNFKIFFSKIPDDKYYVQPFENGRNVTITCFIKNGTVVVFPYIFDFPLIKVKQNLFIKTGGIKAEYSYKLKIKQEMEEEILAQTIKLVGKEFVGFVAIQILLDKKKYHFIEIDLRPGDPEFLNTINSVDENITNLFFSDYFIYHAKKKKNYSFSYSIIGKQYPYENKVAIKKSSFFPMLSNISIHFSKAIVKKDVIENYNNGRIAFLYIQGKYLRRLLIIKCLFYYLKKIYCFKKNNIVMRFY